MCYVSVRFLFGGGRQNCWCGSTWTIAGAVLLLLLCWTVCLFLNVHLLLLAVSARPDVLLPLRALLRVLLPSLLASAFEIFTFFSQTWRSVACASAIAQNCSVLSVSVIHKFTHLQNHIHTFTH